MLYCMCEQNKQPLALWAKWIPLTRRNTVFKLAEYHFALRMTDSIMILYSYGVRRINHIGLVKYMQLCKPQKHTTLLWLQIFVHGIFLVKKTKCTPISCITRVLQIFLISCDLQTMLWNLFLRQMLDLFMWKFDAFYKSFIPSFACANLFSWFIKMDVILVLQFLLG